MQKIGDTTKTADSNGEFTDGDPQKQTPPTWIMAAWLNTLQREVIKVVQEGGLTLDPKDDTQLYQAIEKLMRSAIEGTVKTVNDHAPDASGNVELPDASTTAKGLAQLSSATDSTSETLAATPKAVKAAFDLAASRVSKAGDTMTGQLFAPSFATTPGAIPWGAGAFADQLSSQAPFFQPNWQWPVSAGGLFVPIAKGTSTRKDKGYPGAVSFGYLMPANDEHPHPTIHVKGDSNVDAAWDFNPYSGAISSKAGTFATQEWVNTAVHTNELHVGNAQMTGDGNIWGTRWDSNGGWLWDAIMWQVQNIGQMAVSGDHWWVKINLNGGTLIVQGGRAVGTDNDGGVTDRINLNISVPNRLLHVSMNIKNFGQGYDSGWNPQVGDLTYERDGFSWFHGSKDRDIYWLAVGY